MIIIFWLIFCVLVGVAAQKRGRSFLAFALLSAVISPLGGLIVLLVMGQKTPTVAEAPKFSEPDKADASSLMSNFNTDRAAKSFCPNCGTQIDADTRFCPNCGKQVNA